MNQKCCSIHILIIVLSVCTHDTFSQLVIDAGVDTTLCRRQDSITIGGNPTASGGIEPYNYEWIIYSASNGQKYPARLFLSDSSVSNPSIINNWYNFYFRPISDSIIVKLMVTDSIGNSEIDSIQVNISSITVGTAMGCFYYVISGDSVRVHVCNEFYGLPPYTYQWTPAEIFSDPNEQFPYVKPDTTTIIYVKLTDVFGCSISEPSHVYVTPVGIDTWYTNSLNSLVIPNPITERSEILIRNDTNSTLQIKIFDSQARLIINAFFSNNMFQVGELIQKPGVYYYIISEDSKLISNGKIIKN